MTTTELIDPREDEVPQDPAPSAPSQRRRRRTAAGRRPVRWFFIVSHRWLSLVLGLVLLAITTSGAILLYRPELQRVIDHGAYATSGGARTVTFQQAYEAVEAAHPAFDGVSVIAANGVLKVANADYDSFWTVDPHTGKVLGHIGDTPGWMKFLDNLHECFLSCEGYPGYLKVLAKELPGTKWLGYDDTNITYGNLVLGVFGLILLYLSLTGIWLWFPRPSKWRSSMSVRWSKGRFARDTDLHKVAGMIAIPSLLLWSITGAGFVMEPIEKAWYAVTPGKQLPDVDPGLSAKGKKGPDLGIDRAVAIVAKQYPNDKVVSVDIPAKDDKTAAYNLWLADGFDPYAETEYPGDRGVSVDRHTGKTTTYYGQPGESTSQALWDSWNYPAHAGYIVNGWWRLLWLVFGIAPLLLAVTGVSTWLVRRRNNKRRSQAQRERAALGTA